MKTKHFIIQALEYASKRPNGFTYNDFISGSETNEQEKKILDYYFKMAVDNLHARSQLSYPQNPLTIFDVIEGMGYPGEYKDNKFKYILTNEALFNYFDYQELVFATRNAEEAKRQSNKALYFSIASLVISTLITLWVSTWINDVKIVNDVRLDIDQQKQIQDFYKK